MYLCIKSRFCQSQEHFSFNLIPEVKKTAGICELNEK